MENTKGEIQMINQKENKPRRSPREKTKGEYHKGKPKEKTKGENQRGHA